MTPLTLLVLLGATQTEGVVEHSVGESRSLQQTNCSEANLCPWLYEASSRRGGAPGFLRLISAALS